MQACTCSSESKSPFSRLHNTFPWAWFWTLVHSPWLLLTLWPWMIWQLQQESSLHLSCSSSLCNFQIIQLGRHMKTHPSSQEFIILSLVSICNAVSRWENPLYTQWKHLVLLSTYYFNIGMFEYNSPNHRKMP